LAKILVLGAGMMGSALTAPLARRGHDVRLVGTHLDGAIVESLLESRVHPKLGVRLADQVTPFPIERLDEAARDVEAVALGVSSAGIDWACEKIAPLVRPKMPLFMITKGLVWDGPTAADVSRSGDTWPTAGSVRPAHPESLATLPDVVQRKLPQEVRGSISPAAIAGPCIAGELARQVPTCVVLTGRSHEALDTIAAMIRCDFYHVFPTTDVKGAEICAAAKNAYAMGIAFALGMHERSGGVVGSVAMHNLESAVFAQSVREMRALVAVCGGDPDTASGLAGVGDLDVTTNGGRTGRFGKLLGAGLGPAEAQAKMEGATLECLEILRVLRTALLALEEAGALRMTSFPLLDHLAAVALDGAPVNLPLSRFFGGS
jgi:glycerol-3-phosphate dehydrogenase (NAD(P)+)